MFRPFHCLFFCSFFVFCFVHADKSKDTTSKTNELNAQFEIPTIKKAPLFLETFHEEVDYFDGSKWVKSAKEKYATQDVSIKKVLKSLGSWEQDKSLVLETSHKHYGLVHTLPQVFTLGDDKEHRYGVFQYEVKLTEGLECGGAYFKLLNAKENEGKDYSAFDDKTGYSIMFGPDKCGYSNKVHLIIRQYNPKTKEYEEKALKSPPEMRNDKLTHLYTLVLDKKENIYTIYIDLENVKNGSLFDDFEPSFEPPKEIDDPDDKKPEGWIDEEEIPDPNAVKPEDWDESAPQFIPDEEAKKPEDWLDDEPENIPDPEAAMPEDWDEEEDGRWEAPLVPNPKCQENSGCGEWKRPNKLNPVYKGIWKAPMIKNPAYKGIWKPRKIANPNYFEVKNPANVEPINAIAIEVWTTTGGISFDNLWLGHNFAEAKNFAEKTWKLKNAAEKKEMDMKSTEEKEKLRELKLKEGNWVDTLLVYYSDVREAFISNPSYMYAVGLSMIAVFVTIYILRYKPSTIPSEEEDAAQNPDEENEKDKGQETKTDKENEKAKGEDSKKEEDEDNDKNEVEPEEDVKGETNLRARKRAPKAE